MTWPSGDVPTTDLDEGTDTPPRATFLSWAQKFNQLINHVTAFMQGVLSAGNAADARTALGALSRTMSTGRMLGRVTASSGDVEELTATQVTTTFVNTATESAAGKLEIADDTEAKAGTSDALAMTPLKMKAAQIQLGTAVSLTTQTSVDFTGIPSWAKRVTVLFSGVSSNGTDNLLIQLGDSGGIETSGYFGSGSGLDTTVATTGYSTGFGVRTANAANLIHGAVVIHKVDGNTWAAHGVLSASNIAFTLLTSGTKTLSAALDRVRLTTTGGTNQLDAGSINVSWE